MTVFETALGWLRHEAAIGNKSAQHVLDGVDRLKADLDNEYEAATFWQSKTEKAEAELAAERERVQTMESRFWDAVQPWRERAERLHAVGEQFADDLDSGPSTHLLAVELRNRWRKAWDGGSDAV